MGMPRGLWATEVSKKYPKAVFDIISWIEWGKGTYLADVRVNTAQTWDFAKAINDSYGVINCEGRSTNGCVREIRVIHKDEPFVAAFKRFDTVQRTPIRVFNGACEWEMLGRDENIRRLASELSTISTVSIQDPSSFRNGGTETALPPPPRAARTASKSETNGKTGHLAVCRLRFTLPQNNWMYRMTTKYPGTSLDVLGYSLMDDCVMLDVRINTRDVKMWVKEIGGMEGITSVSPLGRSEDCNSLRVTSVDHSVISEVYHSHLILRTPFTVTRGEGVAVVAGPVDVIRDGIRTLSHMKLQLEKVYGIEKDEHPLLTPRQADIFRRAMAAGYFEVPRRVTLTELAARFGVAISSLSEILAVVEKKLLQASQVSNGG
jgi:predicted DNA binding protein